MKIYFENEEESLSEEGVEFGCDEKDERSKKTKKK
jgi:hypothetical protein